MTDTNLPDRYRWVMLLVGFLFMATFAFTLQQIPPLLALIIADLNLTYTQAGSLMSIFQSSGLILSFLWGVYATRIGMQKTAVIGVILLVIGNLLVASANDLLFLILGRLISGVGALTLPILGGSIVSHWFKGKELGLALGFYNLSMPLGTLICLNTYGILGVLFGWRLPIYLTTTIAILALIFFRIAFKHPPSPIEPLKIDFSNIGRIFIITLPPALTWMFFQATSGSFNTFATLFFLSIGHPLQIATLLASSWMLGSLILSPLVGGLIDRYQNVVTIIMIGCSLVAFSLFALPFFSDIVLIFMTILAFGAALVPTAVLTAAPSRLKSEEIAISFSLIRTFASIGYMFGPISTGILRDVTGDYTFSFLLMCVFMIGSMISIIPFRKPRKKNEELIQEIPELAS